MDLLSPRNTVHERHGNVRRTGTQGLAWRETFRYLALKFGTTNRTLGAVLANEFDMTSI